MVLHRDCKYVKKGEHAEDWKMKWKNDNNRVRTEKSGAGFTSFKQVSSFVYISFSTENCAVQDQDTPQGCVRTDHEHSRTWPDFTDLTICVLCELPPPALSLSRHPIYHCFPPRRAVSNARTCVPPPTYKAGLLSCSWVQNPWRHQTREPMALMMAFRKLSKLKALF